jgi:hypothetical protein
MAVLALRLDRVYLWRFFDHVCAKDSHFIFSFTVAWTLGVPVLVGSARRANVHIHAYATVNVFATEHEHVHARGTTA